MPWHGTGEQVTSVSYKSYLMGSFQKVTLQSRNQILWSGRIINEPLQLIVAVITVIRIFET